MQSAIHTSMKFSPTWRAQRKRTAKAIDKPTAQRRRAMFDGLFALEGMIKVHVTDASTTIDEYLYGWGNASESVECPWNG